VKDVPKASRINPTELGLARVSDEEHARLGLLPGWVFFRLPADADAACTLCGRPAAYVDDGGLPRCFKHCCDF
jgi:ribosomal protein S14